MLDEPGKIQVELYGLCRGCGLIIPHASGVVYLNQVAGMTCDQRSLEGIFVPVGWDAAAEAMEEIFYDRSGLTKSDADRIDAALQLLGAEARVDRDRLGGRARPGCGSHSPGHALILKGFLHPRPY